MFPWSDKDAMSYVFSFLKEQPFVLVFLVVSGGFLLARLRIFGISLGVVTSTLIVGLLLSLWAVQSSNVSFSLPLGLQAIFFNFFIFAVGLKVGPQCFAGLERNGKQLLSVALIIMVATLVFSLLCGWFFQLDAETLAGVIAGANTASASFGAAQAAVQSGQAGPKSEEHEINLSVSFAIAYSLSLVAFTMVLPLLPKLTHTDATGAAKTAENEMGAGTAPLPQTPGALHPAYVPVDIRAYRIEKPRAVGKSLSVLKHLHPRVSVEGVRRAGRMMPIDGNLVLQLGDEVALGGRIDLQHLLTEEVGPEIDVPDLHSVHPETEEVVITRNDLVGKTLDDLMHDAGHGLFFNAVFRMGEQIPLNSQTVFKRGDVLRVTGSKGHIEALAKTAGNLVKNSPVTDLLTVSTGLFLGGIIGALAVNIGSIRLSPGTAAGLLIVAILMSWIRTRYPQLGGPIPEPGRQLIEDLGLSVYITTVGLSAGPGLMKALTSGIVGPIVASTAVIGFVPPLLGWLLGISVLKMNPALLLGAVTGARQNSPALKTAEAAVQSNVPAIGFPLPFTIATLVFTIYGYLTILLWPIK
jgi:putative transport protein